MAVAGLSPLTIRSLEDLAQARAEALRCQQTAQEVCLIRVGTATCGAALGALDTLQAIRAYALEIGLSGILIQETGCLGLCALEPVVEVFLPGRPAVLYGRVTPLISRQILDEHVLRGKVLQEYVIQNVKE
jgi:NADP-reducing hydrogenase subunit HndB